MNEEGCGRILHREHELQTKLNDFIEKVNREWIDRFQKENLLHLNEPLLRKENEYYLVNMKVEVADCVVFARSSYSLL